MKALKRQFIYRLRTICPGLMVSILGEYFFLFRFVFYKNLKLDFFSDCKPKKPSKFASDFENAAKLWDISCKMVGLNCFS